MVAAALSCNTPKRVDGFPWRYGHYHGQNRGNLALKKVQRRFIHTPLDFLGLPLFFYRFVAE